MRIKYFLFSILFLIGFFNFTNYQTPAASAISCPDVEFVFARGSGELHNTGESFQEFKARMTEKLTLTDLSYHFTDLDYPAIALDFGVITGAFVSGGESYAFGESMNAGVETLVSLINNSSCKSTKYVLAGYSQGAMVIWKAMQKVDSEKIIYAATFGDPYIYLPEGAGIFPEACNNSNLSNYRMYVPDCYAYKGILGAHNPYETSAYVDKIGTWCNKMDVLCSSHFSLTDHTSYISDNLYEDASRVIYNKIVQNFSVENTYTSPHDTAILIDSTGSMSSLINQYKAEALRLAKQTLDSGGRVALYDYRDLSDPYYPVQHCNFETCTLELFEAELSTIHANNGGDTKESLLSASLQVMNELNWHYGSTKSLVVLTDADFLSPDRDGVTYEAVVSLSKTIDPVNFYIITLNKNIDSYTKLASDTGGEVVTNLDELNLLTDYIMERFDSLPRVEEQSLPDAEPKPTLEIIETENLMNGDFKVKFTSSNSKTLIVLNEAILGITEESEITLTNLDRSVVNSLSLIPLSDTTRGENVDLTIDTMVVSTPVISNLSDQTTEPSASPNIESETPSTSISNPQSNSPFLSESNSTLKTSLITPEIIPQPKTLKIPKSPDTGYKPISSQ